MVIGYGRIGKVLAKILEGFSADVYVAVRKRDAYAEVRGQGFRAIWSDDMDRYLPQMDFIFNTVPKILLDSKNLHLIKKSCLILDMASKPFGVDREASSKLGLKVLWTPSLPGKTAPETVADYIKETVYSIIEEEGKC